MLYQILFLLSLSLGTFTIGNDIRICTYDPEYFQWLPKQIPPTLCNHIAYMGREVTDITQVTILRRVNPGLRVLFYMRYLNIDNKRINVYLDELFKANSYDGIIFQFYSLRVEPKLSYITTVCKYMKRVNKTCYVTASSMFYIPEEDVIQKIEPITDAVIMDYGVGKTSSILTPPTIHKHEHQAFDSLEEKIQSSFEMGFVRRKIIGSIDLELGRFCKYGCNLICVFGRKPQFGDECELYTVGKHKRFCLDKTMNWFEDEKEGFTYGYDDGDWQLGGYFAAFENPKSAELKTRYMAEEGLAGYLFHSLTIDYYNAEKCNISETLPILTATAKGFTNFNDCRGDQICNE